MVGEGEVYKDSFQYWLVLACSANFFPFNYSFYGTFLISASV